MVFMLCKGTVSPAYSTVSRSDMAESECVVCVFGWCYAALTADVEGEV